MPPQTRRDRERRKVLKSNAMDWANKQNQGRESTSVKLPDGYEWFKPEASKDKKSIYKVDFMPYIVGEGNPNADEGMEHFERTYEVHWVPNGAKNAPFICGQKMGKKCAVCQWMRKNGGTADPELVKSMRAKTRQLWLVNDKPGDPKNKLKVFDAGSFNRGMGFGEQMASAFQSVEDYANFSDLENGYTLQLTVAKQSMGSGGTYNAVTRIDFVPRKHTYDESVRDDAPCLDEMIIAADYDEVMKLLEDGPNDGGDEKENEKEEPAERRPSRNGKVKDEEPDEDLDEDEPEEKPARKSAKKASAHFKVDDVVIYNGKEYDVMSVAPLDGTMLLEDTRGKKVKNVDPADCELVPTKDDEPEEEEKPTRKATSAKKRVPDEDEDDDDDVDEDDSDLEPEDDEDDEPVPAKSKGRVSRR